MFANLIFFCLIAGAFASCCSGSCSSSSSSSLPSSSFSATSITQPPLSEGPCPNVVPKSVDLNKKVGNWFEVQRSVNNYDGSDKCAKVQWRKPVNGVSVVINKSYSNVYSCTATSVLRVLQAPEGTIFIYSNPVLGNVFKDHLVLDIDYKRYSILWTCENRGNGHVETSWVMSRQPKLPKNIDHLKQIAFAKHNLTVPEMITQDFDDCCQYYASYDYCS